VSGVASDAGGGQVGGVEISTDGGDRWHPANGRSAWTYNWTPDGTGPATVMARSVDDSGNIEGTADEVTVDVSARTCPCSIWDDSVVPPVESDPAAVELGVKFRSDVAGEITGLRFYKGAGNTG